MVSGEGVEGGVEEKQEAVVELTLFECIELLWLRGMAALGWETGRVPANKLLPSPPNTAAAHPVPDLVVTKGTAQSRASNGTSAVHG